MTLKDATIIAYRVRFPNVYPQQSEADVLSAIECLQNVQKSQPSTRTVEWEVASSHLAPLFAEMARRTAVERGQ